MPSFNTIIGGGIHERGLCYSDAGGQCGHYSAGSLFSMAILKYNKRLFVRSNLVSYVTIILGF